MIDEKITDEKLYELCRVYGTQALTARRKFIGLLPEVNQRRLYLKKRFDTIYVFAAKLAGVSHKQVNRILQLDRKFEGLPVLRDALVEGEISVSKLARLASIATVENQGALVDMARKLSKAAIETYVRDYKMSREMEGREEVERQIGMGEPGEADEKGGFNWGSDTTKQFGAAEQGGLAEQITLMNHNSAEVQNGLLKPSEGVPGHTFSGSPSTHGSPTTPNFDFEILAALSPELKQKIKELMNKGFDINQLFLQFLANREDQIQREKEKLSAAQQEEQRDKAIIGMPTTRNVAVKIKRVIRDEFGTKCSEPHCHKTATQLHHELGFAKTHSHDPLHLKPLCQAHHEIAHMNDEKVRRYKMIL